MIRNDDIDRVLRRDNITRKIQLEPLDAVGHDDSAGAPVICCYLNTHVGQMV